MFAIVYLTPGISFPFADLDAADRRWLTERLVKQKRDEAAAVKKARGAKG